MKQIVTIIDTFGFFFRSYYALPPLKSKDGFPTGLLTGFMNFIISLGKDFKTDFILFAIDSKGDSFRKEIYDKYKANRSKAPQELTQQLPIAINWIEKMGFKTLLKDGFEADDIIASVATICEKKGYKVRIVSHDKDLYQLINENIFLFDPIKKIDITEKSCILKYNISPKQFIDYQAIVGDSSDNIPGIKGMGAKSATTLLNQFNSLDNIYKNIDFINKPRFKTLLKEHKQDAYISKKLVTLVKNIYDNIDISNFTFPSQNPILKIENELLKYDMQNFVKKVNIEGMYIKTSLPDNNKNRFETIILDDAKELLNIIDTIKPDTIIAFDTETTSLDTKYAKIVGFSFCFDSQKAYYVPISHNQQNRQISMSDAKKAIKLIFSYKVIGHNIKYDLEVLAFNFCLNSLNIYADTMILAWLLNPSSKVSLDKLAKDMFMYDMVKFTDIVDKNSTFADIDIKEASFYASEDAWMTYKIYFDILKHIEPKILQIAKEVEFVFIDVLVKMELRGIRVKREFFEVFQEKLASKLKQIEDNIYDIAKEKFNINSTRQLAKILFEKLDLPSKRKTKTGYSTDEKVLQSIKDKHPIIPLLLDYRELFKMQSTYVKPIIQYAKMTNDTIYTSFLQTGTSTGRLSSKNPNLQNIPTRKKIGKEIKKGFISRDGYKLIAIDYSQIELRLLAHFSKDKTLIEAFKNREDIHTKTAIKIFGKDLADEKRAVAKSINFGILYGMGSNKLSKELKITTKEAKEYIKNYFDSFSLVKEKLEDIKQNAIKDGFIKTLIGRKRYFKFNLANTKELEAYKREAVNTLFQGSAADLIKLSMIKITKEVKEAHILLQIHDELIIEAKEKDAKQIAQKCKDIMINIALLEVPIDANVSIGENLGQLEPL